MVNKQFIQKIGLFLHRENILLPRVKKIPIALLDQLFEAKIILCAIDALLSGQIIKFDPTSVGDCKCQVRAAMIMDIVSDDNFMSMTIHNDKRKLQAMIQRLNSLLIKFDFDQYLQIKKIMGEIQGLSLYEIFEQYDLNLDLNPSTVNLALCFFVASSRDDLFNIADGLSGQKINSLLAIAKKNLSSLSMKYEQLIAKKYGTAENQKSLQMLVTNGYHTITSFFPAFKPIFHKLKASQQAFVKKTIHFCLCGGVQNQTVELYRAIHSSFKEVSMNILSEVVMNIQGYQFEGSFEQLKEILNVPQNMIVIPSEYFKRCECKKSLFIPKLENIEEAIFANFAQHPQFTNDVKIDWDGLGLVDSDLKKEFDYLNTLPGYSINDMSKFCISHIYASTVEQVLQEQKEFEVRLKKK